MLALACTASGALVEPPMRSRAKSPLLASRARPVFAAMGPVAVSASIIGGANALGFAISIATGWHYHLDLIGTGVFAVSAYVLRGVERVQRLSAGCIAMWSAKLAGFLFLRVLSTKHDARLDETLSTTSGAFGFWFISFAWGWFVSLPHTLAASVPAASVPAMRTGCSVLGLGLFAVGIVVETLADAQKWAFKQNAATRGAFCDVGVWRLCQHPNWLGNLLLWSGALQLN